MNILVTGGVGFIGSNLCGSLLKLGHQIIIVDNFDPFYDRFIKQSNLDSFVENDKCHFFEEDIRNRNGMISIFKKFNIDLVVHLAAKVGIGPSMENPDEYISVNIQGTNTLFEVMKEFGVKKMIFASSSSVYGENKEVPFDEEHALNSMISTYAITKESCEHIAFMNHKLFDFSVINLRFFTVYGPGQRPDLAIHKFVKMMFNHEELTIYGDGSTARDYTYIDDIVSGIIASIDYVDEREEKVYETINLGNSYPVQLSDLVKLLEEITGIVSKKKKLPVPPGDVPRTFANISKAKELLGYNPTTSMKEGLKKFVEWFKRK